MVSSTLSMIVLKNQTYADSPHEDDTGDDIDDSRTYFLSNHIQLLTHAIQRVANPNIVCVFRNILLRNNHTNIHFRCRFAARGVVHRCSRRVEVDWIGYSHRLAYFPMCGLSGERLSERYSWAFQKSTHHEMQYSH